MDIFIVVRKWKSIDSGFYSIFTNFYGKKIQIEFRILKEHKNTK